MIAEFGSGPPLVLIPGLPGPWEYTRPAIEELRRSYRVLALPLGPEASIESDVARIVQALDDRRIDRAIVCGISFGGLIALRFAAMYPSRTRALVLASVPGPGMKLRPRHRLYAEWPMLFGSLFFVETPLRVRREVARALPRWPDRWRFVSGQLNALVAAGIPLRQTARRALLLETLDVVSDCRQIVSPSLVVTGESALDWVVPVGETTQYVQLIPGARHHTLEGTGHLGTITRPAQFASAVASFISHVEARGEVA